jgi:DNA processing protein
MFAATTLLMMSNEEILHWLALRLVPGLGARKTVILLERFKSPIGIFRASTRELEGAGLPGTIARSISSGCTFEDAVTQQEKLAALGGTLIPMTSPEFPALLKEIYDPPPVLFARGDTSLLDSLMLGVVGSRKATPYGVAVTERLSADLAKAGLTIISGMARGIDTAAHKAALAVQGKTVAVWGCGLDLVYPSENRHLAEQIARDGLIITEFPIGTPAYPQNFPIRNRIVSGMSTGLLVVEGAEYSGSSITARLALDQNREVFAIPGNITNKTSWGPNLLIKQGAHLVQDWHDVMEGLPQEAREQLAAQRSLLGPDETIDRVAASLPQGLSSPVGQQVISCLTLDKPISLDSLVENVDCASTSEIISTLLELELAGLVRQLPGKNFVKVWYE